MVTKKEAARPSRRALLKYALGTIGTIATPLVTVGDIPSALNRTYEVVDRRALADGGVGLFIRVAPSITREGLGALGAELRAEYADQANVVVEIFDDADAARTVRSGSRLVGEQRFAAAKARQRASYQKSAKPRREFLTILDPPLETIRY